MIAISEDQIWIPHDKGQVSARHIKASTDTGIVYAHVGSITRYEVCIATFKRWIARTKATVIQP